MKRGLALILVVGVLAVLAMMGSAFAVLSRLERKSSAQRVQGTQAQLLARSGLEDAQARLDAGQDPVYGGEDWDDSRVLDGIEDDPPNEVYRKGLLDRDGCPVRQAMRPSFFTCSSADFDANGRPAPLRIRVEGRERGYSGRLKAGTWALRAVPDGGFPVNGGDPSFQTNPATTSDLNTCLRRMLGVLAEAIDREDGANNGIPVDQTDGEKLISLRPLNGWQSFDQIRTGALGGSQAKLDALRDYLVLTAWSDRKVIAPNMDPGNENKIWRLTTFLGIGRWNDPASMDGFYFYGLHTRRRPDFEKRPRTQLFGANTGKLVGRPPVDLAWARTRRPALIALLANLQGLFWQELSTYETNCTYGYMRKARITLDWTATSDDCRRTADAIRTTTSELRTWEQFHAFCDALPFTDFDGATLTTELAQARRDLIKANFNPNTDVNKFNPEEPLKKLLDKTDLQIHSLELNLSPRGAWRVSAVGRARLAVRVLSLRTEDRMFRLTTQREFTAGSLGDLDHAGDEGGYRAYGAPTYITASSGTHKTFGHKLVGAPASGVSVQSYPEPHTVAAPAYWDGQLKLATVETADDEDYQTTPVPNSMRFLARFDDAFEAEPVSKGDPTLTPNAAPANNLTNQDSPSSPAATVWPDFGPPFTPVEPGALYPCGTAVESAFDGPGNNTLGSVPGWRVPNNIPSDHGTISYWFKPVSDTRKWKGGSIVSNYGARHLSNSRDLNAQGYSLARTFNLSNCAGSKGTMPKSNRAFEIWWFAWDKPFVAPPPDKDEQVRITIDHDILPRWHLGTFFWDMKTPRNPPGGIDDPSTRILINRGIDVTLGERNTSWSYAGDPPFRPITGSPGDMTEYKGGPATFYLSNRKQADNWTFPGNTSNTFDEIAVYDFGLADGGASDGVVLSERLAERRFVAGRFYKESEYYGLGAAGNRAGQWFSAPVDLGKGYLKSLSWTQYVPRGLRAPAAAVLEDGDDGDDGRVALELSDAAGTGYAIPGYFTRSQGERLGGRIPGPFRLHAVFQPNLESIGDRAILEPLVLDDITVSYRPLAQSPFKEWREGE